MGIFHLRIQSFPRQDKVTYYSPPIDLPSLFLHFIYLLLVHRCLPPSILPRHLRFDVASVPIATLPLQAVPSPAPPPSRHIGCAASFLPGLGAYFLFVLTQGATRPGRPTAWSLPAVSTWHSLARRARVTPPESGRQAPTCTGTRS